MNEKDILDLVIPERINTLLIQRKRTEPCADKKTLLLTEQAEALLKQLPKEDWMILTRYMDHQTNVMAESETYLYSCGVTDGIRMMRYISNL